MRVVCRDKAVSANACCLSSWRFSESSCIHSASTSLVFVFVRLRASWEGSAALFPSDQVFSVVELICGIMPVSMEWALGAAFGRLSDPRFGAGKAQVP